MRRLFFSAFIIPLMMFAACEKPSTENQNNEQQQPEQPQQPEQSQQPDVETYKGAQLPKDDQAREKMDEVLSLIAEQEGDVDIDEFVDMLTSELFSCKQRFIYVDYPDGAEPDYWSWAGEWDGGVMCRTLCLNTEGDIYCRYSTDDSDIDFGIYLEGLGIKGYHTKSTWVVENNVIYTGADGKYEAKVLYFDGARAVLEGLIYSMVISEGNDSPERYPTELYLFEFAEGRDTYLTGYDKSKEEYLLLREEFYANDLN